MPIITVVSASHCLAEETLDRVIQETGYQRLSQEQIFALAAKRFGTDEKKLLKSMQGPRPFFENLTHERERHIAYIKAALAELIQTDDIVLHGLACHLIPKSLEHILRVCLLASTKFRIDQAMRERGLSKSKAKAHLEKEDEKSKQWTLHLYGLGPWDKRLYDLIIPMDKTSVKMATADITKNAAKPLLASTHSPTEQAGDFLMAAKVEVSLTEKGHHVDVECQNGVVTLLINKYVLRLNKEKKEIADIASKVEGVNEVVTKIGPKYRPPSIYANMDLPQKILLVDDEKEFVHTLSERLQNRNLESVIAYDGEQALQIAQDDEPDVMVLDLKMPGIDGLEVLRKVKQEHEQTEVIILTGHGSEAEQKLALELGAFAYLNKPVDIDVLTHTMKQAYQRVVHKKVSAEGEATRSDGD